MHILLIGPPGSGKGTQAKMISSYYRLPHISMGDLLRDVARQKTKTGAYVRKRLEVGKMVPDDLTTEILKTRLKNKDCQAGFILDGYPRNMSQSKMLGPKFHVDYAIYLKVPTNVVVSRLTSRRQCKGCNAIYGIELPPRRKGLCDRCGSALYQRSDDRKRAIRARLRNFSTLTKPLINYYKRKGILRTVNGNQTPERIFETIKKILK